MLVPQCDSSSERYYNSWVKAVVSSKCDYNSVSITGPFGLAKAHGKHLVAKGFHPARAKTTTQKGFCERKLACCELRCAAVIWPGIRRVSELFAGNTPRDTPKPIERFFMADPTLMTVSTDTGRQLGRQIVPEFGKLVSRPSDACRAWPSFCMSEHLDQVLLRSSHSLSWLKSLCQAEVGLQASVAGWPASAQPP